MKFRIRGPSGQSTVTLDDDSATVQTLQKTITTETSLESFDIKFGYPLKSLSLDQYPASTKLTDLGVKFNGEQIIVSKVEKASGNDVTGSVPKKPGDNGMSYAPPRNPSGASSSRPGSADAKKPIPSNSSKPPAGPLSLQRRSNAEMESDPPEILLPELGGSLLLRIMPDDNSCLFRAVASAVMPDIDTMTEMRSYVAQTIQNNPERYSKPVLDNKEPDDYCRWIQTEAAWGGQIELNILSQQFDIEICSIDVQTLRVDHYNEGKPTRCIVVYSGIHYDTIALNPFESPPEDDVKVFQGSMKDAVLIEAVELCQTLRDRHYYTDTSAFKIRCNDCGTMCVGEAGATEHAS